jgi:hypothetical protein
MNLSIILTYKMIFRKITLHLFCILISFRLKLSFGLLLIYEERVLTHGLSDFKGP